MINMTVEDIIKQSVAETKQLNQKKRRNWVRRMLNYYGGNEQTNILKIIFLLVLFKKFLPIVLILLEGL